MPFNVVPEQNVRLCGLLYHRMVHLWAFSFRDFHWQSHWIRPALHARKLLRAGWDRFPASVRTLWRSSADPFRRLYCPVSSCHMPRSIASPWPLIQPCSLHPLLVAGFPVARYAVALSRLLSFRSPLLAAPAPAPAALCVCGAGSDPSGNAKICGSPCGSPPRSCTSGCWSSR